MKIKPNNINLDTVPGFESVNDNQAEKCVGGSFVVDLGDYGNSGTTAPYLVSSNSASVYVGGPLEQITLANVARDSSNGQFSVEFQDRNRNVISTTNVSSSQTIGIPGAGTDSQAVFANIVRR